MANQQRIVSMFTGMAECLQLCRFYGASGEEITSIGADVNRTTEPPCHSSASRMTLVDP